MRMTPVTRTGMPASSRVSRTAASVNDSPASTRPPGRYHGSPYLLSCTSRKRSPLRTTTSAKHHVGIGSRGMGDSPGSPAGRGESRGGTARYHRSRAAARGRARRSQAILSARARSRGGRIMPTIRVNGAELYYEETGAGEQAVLFAPGLGGGTRLFRAQVAALAD